MITDSMRVGEAFNLIGKANNLTICSLDEMKAIVLRALDGEFDDAIIMEQGQEPLPENPIKKLINSVPPPVDRTQQVLTDGSRVTQDHRELLPNGQQKGYIVLTEAERAKGFVRPVRNTYVHVGKPPEGEKFEYPVCKRWGQACGQRTKMGTALAETYARDPGFYSGTFCVTCRAHFPLDQFVWEGTVEQVGS